MKRIFLLFFLLPILSLAQDPMRFQKEVQQLTANDGAAPPTGVILFTGSSSIRKWTDLDTRFPGKPVLNRGFGGSEMSDLVYYFDKLILPYHPKQIFIYEGDNDISANRSTETILNNAQRLLVLIREKLGSKVSVVFISPKPSLARWNLRDRYHEVNAALEAWTRQQKGVAFADVWPVMLDKNGEVFKDIFIEDGLHMNSKGYDLWMPVITKLMVKR
jgi:lysophospholipase L1-like esterase